MNCMVSNKRQLKVSVRKTCRPDSGLEIQIRSEESARESTNKKQQNTTQHNMAQHNSAQVDMKLGNLSRHLISHLMPPITSTI